MDSTETQPARALVLASAIVTAYVGHHRVGRDELPVILRSVHGVLNQLGRTSSAVAAETHKATPIEIKRSITADHLVSFEDGRSYQTLRRHLGQRGLTPEQYRVKWGLPVDYPMTAPSYSARRSDLARASQLGHRPRVDGITTPADAREAILPTDDLVAKPDEEGNRTSSSGPDEDALRDEDVETITREPFEGDVASAETQ